jgi:hypothetical protein
MDLGGLFSVTRVSPENCRVQQGGGSGKGEAKGRPDGMGGLSHNRRALPAAADVPHYYMMMVRFADDDRAALTADANAEAAVMPKLFALMDAHASRRPVVGGEAFASFPAFIPVSGD